MTTGMHTTNLVNKWLDMLGGTAFTAPATTHVKLHTGDPLAAATAAPSSVTTRMPLTWGAASAGGKALTGTLPSWTNWAGTNGETISHISIWDNSTAGNVLFTAALATPKVVNTGDTLNLTALTFGLTPLMA